MTDYQIIPDDSGRFAVKITFASGHSRVERGFRTEPDAKAWLESEREKRPLARPNAIGRPNGYQAPPSPP
jgi:hypothetical protein